jgi:S-(hydroxymethyl)glutathione dehydrogenase/alcohol dehydrogenase
MFNVNAALGLVIMEKQVRGCWYGSSNVQRDIPALTRLYSEGKLMLDELISAEISLIDVNDALDNMGSGSIARSVIKYS